MEDKKEVIGFICGATKGHYGLPRPATELKWENGDGKPIKPPKTWYCEICRRSNQRSKRYPMEELFFQRWELTREELEQALKGYDMFSLDMPPRIICAQCAEEEKKKLEEKWK